MTVSPRPTPIAPSWLAELAHQLKSGVAQVMVTVGFTQGSAPRDAGARMYVSMDSIVDTIGGGHLEWKAIAHARHMLRGAGPARQSVRYALGPSLGQCCGGVVGLMFELLGPDDASWCEDIAAQLARGHGVQRTMQMPVPDARAAGQDDVCLAAPVLKAAAAGQRSRLDVQTGRWVDVFQPAHENVVVCGAGNIGTAIVRLLADMPVRVTWLDPRPDGWPAQLPSNVCCVQGDADDVPDMPEDAYWLVMTHSHALDLALIDAVYRHKDFAYIGLIGSKTKKARFVSRLRQRHNNDMVERLVCPIGLLATSSKQPAVIAVSVVAQLLALMST